MFKFSVAVIPFPAPTSGVWCRPSAASWVPCPGDSHGIRLERENCVKNILTCCVVGNRESG